MLKRILTLLAVAILAVGPALLAGCNDDEVRIETREEREVELTEPRPVVD
jgi:hypothetical protein